MTTERVWEQFSHQLKRFFIARVSHEQIAEDLLQETFLRIHRKLPEVDDNQRIAGWVFRIARNLLIDFYRSKGKHQEFSAMDFEEASPDEEDNLNKLVMSWLPGMIAQLPDKYRNAVELYELKGISQQAIADQLQISLSGAKSRVQRGREKLKLLLHECCSFEKDKHGNIINYVPKKCEDCECE